MVCNLGLCRGVCGWKQGSIGGDLSWYAYDKRGLFWLDCVGVWLEFGVGDSACDSSGQSALL